MIDKREITNNKKNKKCNCDNSTDPKPFKTNKKNKF